MWPLKEREQNIKTIGKILIAVKGDIIVECVMAERDFF
jgi:hypothetical protein